MKERKYKEDWKNEMRIDDRGREKRVPVYRGSWYNLPAGKSAKSLLPQAVLLLALYLGMLVAWFIVDFPGTRILYVFLPAAVSLFPCLYWVLGVWGLYRAPQKMTRLQKENSVGRILRSAAGCAIFSVCALVGDIVYLFAGSDPSGEWPGTILLLCAAASAVIAVSVFRNMNRGISEEGGKAS